MNIEIKRNRLASALCLMGAMWVTPAIAQEKAVPVKVVNVKVAEQSKLSLSGNLYSKNMAQLTSGATGQIEWIAEPGTHVESGDVVAKIDTYPLILEQSEQKAQIKREKINLHFLNRELKRLKDLRATNSASALQLDQTQSQFELAQSDLEIAQLRLQQVEDKINRASVVAPFSGVVTKRLQRIGVDVSKSQPLISLQDINNLELRVFVPIKYLHKVSLDQQLAITSGSDAFDAQITSIIPVGDARSQTFEVRADVPFNLANGWTPGQIINTQVALFEPNTKLSVHRDALILRQNGTFIVKIDKDNLAHRLPVVVGRGQGEWVSVSGNLNLGDRIATRGAERLQDGQKVVIN